MDFAEFERLVLRVIFETSAPLSAPHVAYLSGLTVRSAERYLARMVEDGTLLVRASAAGQIEYYFPGRRTVGPTAAALAAAGGVSASVAAVGREPSSPITAVLLSVLIPGAGHVYAGRSAAGVAWMATTLMGYACFFLPGLFLHGLCLVSAASGRHG